MRADDLNHCDSHTTSTSVSSVVKSDWVLSLKREGKLGDAAFVRGRQQKSGTVTESHGKGTGI